MFKTIILLLSLFSWQTYALESRYQFTYKDSPEDIKKRLKEEIQVEKNKDHTSISYNTPQEFKPGVQDVFELIDSPSESKSDRLLQKIVIADPLTGRIFHLNRELKVTMLDLVGPWKSKAKLKNLKAILEEITQPKIEKKK